MKTLGSQRKQQLRALGINISRLREERGITQTNLALMLGHTNHAYLSRIENGKKAPNLLLLLEIADILEVDVNDLLAGLSPHHDAR